MLKVHVLYEYSNNQIHGVSFIRLLLPLGHPKLAHSVVLSFGRSYEGVDADIIIVDRLWKKGIKIEDAEKLIKYSRENGITFIYSLDDNLLDHKVDEPGYIFPSVEERNIIRYFIRESDGIIVSTYTLRERIKYLNERVIVVENALDERLIRKDENNLPKKFHPVHEKDKLVIGYMGTQTHDRDFMEAFPAIRKILCKYKNVKLEILGVLSDKRLLKTLPNTMEVDIQGNVSYPKFWRWMNENIFWDIAIAPLEKNEFTKCKSDIKFLDYSARGIAGIYTKHVPFENTIIHGKTGLHVENDTESWFAALELLINDENLRKSLGRNAREYVFSNRVLDKCVFKWEEALWMIQEKKMDV